MSRYNVEFKPGSTLSKDSAFKLKLKRKSIRLTAEQEAALASGGGIAIGEPIPPPTELEITLVYPEGMTGGSVSITDGAAFDETITETTVFELNASTYTLEAASVAGHTVRIFTTPQVVEAETKTCAFVIYDEIGAGGDCTPTCSLTDDLRWIPVDTLPSTWTDPILDFPLRDVNAVRAIPDSDFTIYYDVFDDYTFSRSKASTICFARFFGTMCPGDILQWEVFGSGLHTEIVGGGEGEATSYTYSTELEVVTAGNTVSVYVNLDDSGGGTPSGADIGALVIKCQLWHEVDGVFEPVCVGLDGWGDPTTYIESAVNFTFNPDA